ncbi:MAG: hypothetical protein UHS51_07315, partial [Atopobiaceae bacterium]|nr:hypothetical protein [Atopobiaceae bacterium]
MKKTVSFALAVLMAFAPIPAPALAEAIEEPIVLTQDEAGVADQTEEVLLLDGQGTASDAENDIELGAETDEPDDPAIVAQDGATPKFHIQTAQVQGINGTTLASGPNYKHVPTTYYYDLGKGDYPVPYRGDGWPLNYSNYMQASGIYFPGDKIVFIPVPDPTPFNGAHGLPGKVIHNEKGEYGEYAKGDRIGPLLVSGSVTLGSWHTHTYITELTVVDGPVMFSTESGNSGASGWADSGPDDYGHATEWWPVSSIRYIELPKYHPVEYHYYCGDAEIPASDLANMFYYPNQPANPEVIWAEDLSSNFIPYETGMGYDTWTKFRAGNVFTFSRPY